MGRLTRSRGSCSLEKSGLRKGPAGELSAHRTPEERPMLLKPSLPRTHRYQAWEAFTKGGGLAPGAFSPRVATSWKRCAEANLNPLEMNISRVLSEQEWKAIVARNDPLLDVSKSSLHLLEKSLTRFSHAILLCDPDGNILYQSGTGRVLEDFNEAGLVAGGNCSETVLGSTAPGIVLVEQKPVVVVQEEHYSRIYHWCCCAAAPIVDIDGKFRGCLDVTTSYEQAREMRLLLGLTMTTVRSIQAQLHVQQLLRRADETREILNCTFGLAQQAVLVLNSTGRIVHANPQAAHLLRRPLAELAGTDYRALMESPAVEETLREARRGSGPLKLFQPGMPDRRIFVHTYPLHSQRGGPPGAVLLLHEEKRSWSVPGAPKGRARATYAFDDIRGSSPLMQRAKELARRFASTDLPILLEGETGTGKELFAQAIHNLSPRSEGPFMAVNCAAIPRELVESELFGYQPGAFTGARKEGQAGKFESADGGTLFLDEVNSMEPATQAKLLRVLENGEVMRLGDSASRRVDVRVIAASSSPLLEQVRSAGFREDLYFRLNIVRIRLPALRERTEDIEEIALHVLGKAAARYGKPVRRIHPDVLDRFRRHPWPGNVRELENCLNFAVCLCDGETIELVHLPDSLLDPAGPDATGPCRKAHTLERSIVQEALESSGGRVGEAARKLGLSRSTFYRRRKQFGLCRGRADRPRDVRGPENE